MLHENVHRNFVAKKVSAFVGASGLQSLKNDLRDKDWRLSGSGKWTSTKVSVIQTGKDRFSIEIEY